LNETPRDTNKHEEILTTDNIHSERNGENLVKFSHRESIIYAKDDLLGWDL
jgi:hypothetical protein